MKFKESDFKIIHLTIAILVVGVLEFISIILIGPIISLVVNSKIPEKGLAKTIVDKLKIEDEFNLIALYSIFIIAVAIIRILVIGYQTRQSYALSSMLSKRLVYKSLNSDYSFWSNLDSNKLIAMLTTKTDIVAHNYIIPMLNLISSFIILALIMVGIVKSLGMEIILNVAVLAAIYTLIILSTKKILNKISVKINNEYNKSISLIKEVIYGNKEIRLNGKSELFIKKFNEVQDEIATVRATNYTLGISPRILIESVIVGAGLLYIAYKNQYSIGGTSVAIMGVMLYSILKILPLVQSIYLSYVNIKSTKEIYTELNDLIGKSVVKNNNIIIYNESNEIKIERIYSFKTKKEYSINLKGPEFVIIKGKSGAGKSTLLDIISGMHGTHLEGGLKYCGSLITENTLSCYHNVLSYVNQYPFLFNGNIYYNILIKDNFTENEYNEVNKYLILLNLNEFVGKLDEYISEARQLSGGQRQKIGLIRALIRSPRIILLDEVTSAQDEASRITMMNIVENYVKENKALAILVTHDNKNEIFASRIINVD